MPFKNEETSHDKIFESFSKDLGGLMLCTEYLGFESYDMSMSENEVENKTTCHLERKKNEENVLVSKRERKTEFPPPLSSLNSRGQPSFYLRPLRKDGRLELSQVMIDRPEIFHASREDGRLTLRLVDGVDNPIRAYCDPEEPKSLDRPHLESGSGGVNEKHDATSHQVIDSIKDDKCSHEVSLNSDDHGVAHFNNEHDAKEWRYKCCYQTMVSRNHEENDYHHHHNIHPHHHYNRKNNMQFWSRSYVKTR